MPARVDYSPSFRVSPRPLLRVASFKMMPKSSLLLLDLLLPGEMGESGDSGLTGEPEPRLTGL